MTAPEPDDLYLTNSEAQRFLRCTDRQLKALRQRGEIDVIVYGHRTVRYPLSSLRDFVERSTIARQAATS